mmetsp:Transcript_70968/g.154205  ORF Transcript_70968/g.154205 Transcript_70968/m.154205 type:complete len:323 (-) Transcript_70968:1072-2040(-)
MQGRHIHVHGAALRAHATQHESVDIPQGDFVVAVCYQIEEGKHVPCVDVILLQGSLHFRALAGVQHSVQVYHAGAVDVDFIEDLTNFGHLGRTRIVLLQSYVAHVVIGRSDCLVHKDACHRVHDGEHHKSDEGHPQKSDTRDLCLQSCGELLPRHAARGALEEREQSIRQRWEEVPSDSAERYCFIEGVICARQLHKDEDGHEVHEDKQEAQSPEEGSHAADDGHEHDPELSEGPDDPDDANGPQELHNSHRPEDGQLTCDGVSADAILEKFFEQGCCHNEEIEEVPAIAEEMGTEGRESHEEFHEENDSEDGLDGTEGSRL